MQDENLNQHTGRVRYPLLETSESRQADLCFYKNYKNLILQVPLDSFVTLTKLNFD